MRDEFFRVLDAEEEREFRQWARENWNVDEPINEVWHPVVRDECARITRESEGEEQVCDECDCFLDRDGTCPNCKELEAENGS